MATLAAAATFMRPFPTSPTSRQGIEDDAKPLVAASDSTATMATLPSLLPDGSSTTDTTPETVELHLDNPKAAAPTRRRRFSVDNFFGRKAAAATKTGQQPAPTPTPQLAIKVISAPTLISAPPRPRAKSNASRAAPAVAVKARSSTSSFTNGSAFHEHLSDDESDEQEQTAETVEETVEETADDGLDIPSTDYSSDSDLPTTTTIGTRDATQQQLQRANTIDAAGGTASRRRAKIMRRVSFSPSTDEAQKAREMALAEVAAREKQQPGARLAFWRRSSGSKKKEKKADDGEDGESHDEKEVEPSKPAIRPRRSSLVLMRTHSKQEDDDAPKEAAAAAPSKVTIDSSGVHAAPSSRKRRPSISRVNKHTALAQKHARNLEQLVNSSSPLHDHSQAVMVVGGSGASKSKKEKKGDVVSKRNVKKLKKALVDERLAHGIISELRGMEGPRAAVVEIDASTKAGEGEAAALSPAQLALQEAAATSNAGAAARPGFVGQIRRRLTSTASAPPASLTAAAAATTTSASDSVATSTASVARGRPAPQRAICLDCSEAEADRRHQQALKPKPKPKPAAVVKKKEPTAPAPPSPAMSPATDMLLGLGNRLKYLGFGAQEAKPSAEEPAEEQEQEEEEEEQSLERGSAAPTPVQSNSSTPQLLGVNALNLLSMPAPSAGLPGTALSTALDASGAIPALGALSGTVVRATGSNISIHPPLDRMALFIHWWGYEITLPPPTMAYLSTAQSVSGAFLNFLSTIVITGGVPELTPFIKYISMALDVEFRAIKQADMGKGVVLAATWVIPMALVPRAWDYETGSAGGGGGAASPPPSQGGSGGGTPPSYYKRKVVHRSAAP